MSSACGDLVFGAGAEDLRAVTRAGAILHSDNFFDCADIKMPGAGSIFSNDFDSGWLLVHEAGHFVFGLADEYPAGGHKSCSNPYNVFDSQIDCKNEEGPVTPEESKCVQIDSTGKWRIDEDLEETMDDDDKEDSGFQRSSADAVVNRLIECQKGLCYESGVMQCNSG